MGAGAGTLPRHAPLPPHPTPHPTPPPTHPLAGVARRGGGCPPASQHPARLSGRPPLRKRRRGAHGLEPCAHARRPSSAAGARTAGPGHDAVVIASDARLSRVGSHKYSDREKSSNLPSSRWDAVAWDVGHWSRHRQADSEEAPLRTDSWSVDGPLTRNRAFKCKVKRSRARVGSPTHIYKHKARYSKKGVTDDACNRPTFSPRHCQWAHRTEERNTRVDAG